MVLPLRAVTMGQLWHFANFERRVTRDRQIDWFSTVYSQLLPQPLLKMPPSVVLGIVTSQQAFVWMGMSPCDQLHILHHRYLISVPIGLQVWCFPPKLIFLLNSARDWKQEHAGFHYPSFYNFIVDFFEDAAEDNLSTTAVNKILQWWNRYVFLISFFNLIVLCGYLITVKCFQPPPIRLELIFHAMHWGRCRRGFRRLVQGRHMQILRSQLETLLHNIIYYNKIFFLHHLVLYIDVYDSWWLYKAEYNALRPSNIEKVS